MTQATIDLRSDTVTRPCNLMMQAMQNAQLGDDVYGEDPSVIELQQTLSSMTGHETGLFFPSGTQSNLVALLTHCGRGDEYIVAQDAHTYKYEGGGAAALGGIQPQPLLRDASGTLNLDEIEVTIKDDDIHFAKTRLLTLENTTGGMVIPVDYLQRAAALCRTHGLALHLDGARAFNAAVALGVEISEITRHFDTVSICLSKGLGAPVGSVLCGSEAFLERALRWRKMAGGGMRQAGILAAAGLFAIKNNVHRLAQDHDLAAYLAEQLGQFDDIKILHGGSQTNMVFFTLNSGRYSELLSFAKQNGVLLGGRDPVRLVTHKDLSTQDVDVAVQTLGRFFDSDYSGDGETAVVASAY